jgi:hypothetical protein
VLKGLAVPKYKNKNQGIQKTVRGKRSVFSRVLRVFFIASLLLPLTVAFIPYDALAAPDLSATTVGPNLDELGICGGKGIGQSICNFIKSSEGLPGMATGIAYLIGIIFAFTGILKVKEHVEAPQQTPIWDAIKRFAAGGALFALPMVTEALFNSVSGGMESYGYTGFSGEVSAGGLDAMLVALVKDLWGPMHGLVAAFGYMAGIIFTMIGILRLLKTSQDGPKGPGGFGTIMTFATAAALFSLDPLMGAFSFSIFGDPVTATEATLAYADSGLTGAEKGHIHAVISAIIGFVAMLGWISFVRGWFILRDVAEGGQQASMMAAVTHVIGGSLAVNLGPLLNMVQFTLGIDSVGVAFG